MSRLPINRTFPFIVLCLRRGHIVCPVYSISRSINKEYARVDSLLYDKIIVWSCYFTGIPFIENTVKKMRSDAENIQKNEL